MILGAEVVLLVLGLIGLVGGWFPGATGRSVRGIPARFLGLIALLPIPIAIAVIFLVGFVCGVFEVPIAKEMEKPLGIVIELLVVAGFVGLISFLGHRWSDPSRVDPVGIDLDPLAPPAKSVKGGPIFLDDDLFMNEDPRSATTSGMARASLMLGVFSLLASILASIPAFILGGLALVRIERSGGRIAGKASAVAGIILGIIGTFTGFIALALLIPFLRTTADPGPVNIPQPVVVAPPRKNQPLPEPTKPRAPEPVVARADREPEAVTKKAPVRPRPSKAKGGFARSDQPAPVMAIDSKPKSTGASLASKPKNVVDLKVTDLKVDAAKVPRCLFWGDDGAVVFVLETDGTLRRVVVDRFIEELKWEVGQKCSWLSDSSEGLVLTVDSLQEVWVLDPKTFAIKSRTPADSVTRAASSPAIAHAFATNKSGDQISLIDLKAAKVTHQFDARSFPGQNVGYARLVVSPDGKSLFAEGMERLMRFDFDGDELTFAEQSERIAQNGRAIEISADGAYVALPSGGGNYGQPSYTTIVYRTSSLTEPDFKITSGAYPQCLGFDIQSGLVYAQNHDDPLILFKPDGTKAKSYRLSTNRSQNVSPRQFLVHPDGGKLLVLSDTGLSFVELPQKKP